MSDFSNLLESHRRLAALKHLSEAAGGRANDSLIHGILEDVGLAASRDQVRTMISWLGEQDLVIVSRPMQSVMVAQITERGIDVARGLSECPGVQKPSPAAKMFRDAGGF